MLLRKTIKSFSNEKTVFISKNFNLHKKLLLYLLSIFFFWRVLEFTYQAIEKHEFKIVYKNE